ncbi:MAG: D-glycerate dehydrogenase [Chloroflexota bacterium]|nr:D-glycerate dehydrogenase [Chloroflexota bacterium]
MQPRVFITRTIAQSALKRISEVCQVDLWDGEMPPPNAILADRVQGVDGVLSMITDRIDANIIHAAGAPLKVISNMAVGYNNIDVATAKARGIAVGNTPGVLTDATADLTMALLLAAARRIPESIDYVRSGEWRTWHPEQLLGRDLAGASLGIVGFGRIGQAVAQRARAFGMIILAYSPSLTADAAAAQGATLCDLTTLLKTADFVSLHTPLNQATLHLINLDTLALMKPNAILINTSRGRVVDQSALYTALTTGMIGGAALDVTDPEPMHDDDPLLMLNNVLVLPHIGSATHQTRERMALIAADNLIAGVTGSPLPYSV